MKCQGRGVGEQGRRRQRGWDERGPVERGRRGARRERRGRYRHVQAAAHRSVEDPVQAAAQATARSGDERGRHIDPLRTPSGDERGRLRVAGGEHVAARAEEDV